MNHNMQRAYGIIVTEQWDWEAKNIGFFVIGGLVFSRREHIVQM